MITCCHKTPPLCLEIPSHTPFVAIILFHFMKPFLPAPSEAPSAKPAVCFQGACATHFRSLSSVSRRKQKAAHSGWMSQLNQTALTNRWLVYWQFLQEVLLSVSVSSLLSSFSPHFTLCFSHKLPHTNLKAVSLILSSEILKCSKPNGLRCHEWKRLFFCFSPTHLNTCFSNSLSSLSPLWFGETALQCGQSVWVGFDLSSAAPQLTCVFDSRSPGLRILRKIWCHYFLSKLCGSLWNQTGVRVCVRVCMKTCFACAQRGDGDRLHTSRTLNYLTLLYSRLFMFCWIKSLCNTCQCQGREIGDIRHLLFWCMQILGWFQDWRVVAVVRWKFYGPPCISQNRLIMENCFACLAGKLIFHLQ